MYGPTETGRIGAATKDAKCANAQYIRKIRVKIIRGEGALCNGERSRAPLARLPDDHREAALDGCEKRELDYYL